MSYNISNHSMESKIIRSYNFESDDESHVNGDDLSELSDVFIDSDNEKGNNNSKLNVECLSIDDIPYDRDLKWINVPNGARPKTLLQNNHLMRQVRNITKGNAAELAELNQHYIAMDERKRNHENKFLVEVETDSFRNRHKENRSRKGGRGRERGVDGTRGRGLRSEGRKGRGKHTDMISDEEDDKIDRNQQYNNNVRRRGKETQQQKQRKNPAESNKELKEYKYHDIKNINGKLKNNLEHEHTRYSSSSVPYSDEYIAPRGYYQQEQQQQEEPFDPYDPYDSYNNANAMYLPLDSNYHDNNNLVEENYINYGYKRGEKDVPQNVPSQNHMKYNIKQQQQQQSYHKSDLFYSHPNEIGVQQKVEYIAHTKSKPSHTRNNNSMYLNQKYNEYDYDNKDLYQQSYSYPDNTTDFTKQHHQQQYSLNVHDMSQKDTIPMTTSISVSSKSSNKQLTPTAPVWEPKLNPTAAEFVPSWH